jgi:hypothetical protein
MWLDEITEYTTGFAFGLFIFQSPFPKQGPLTHGQCALMTRRAKVRVPTRR